MQHAQMNSLLTAALAAIAREGAAATAGAGGSGGGGGTAASVPSLFRPLSGPTNMQRAGGHTGSAAAQRAGSGGPPDGTLPDWVHAPGAGNGAGLVTSGLLQVGVCLAVR